MNWTPPQAAEFTQHFEDLFGNQPRALLQALGKALGRFPVASVLDVLTGIAMRSERRQRPSIDTILDALSNAGQHVQKPGLCRYCDGVKLFPIQLCLIETIAATEFLRLPKEQRRVVEWTSTRTDRSENERKQSKTALHKSLWDRWPKSSNIRTFSFHCKWCAPPNADPAFTTARLTNGQFSRLDPNHGHLARDLERCLRRELVQHGHELDGKEVATDEKLWDELLDKAADENDMKRFERLKEIRERLAKGGGVKALLG